MNQSVDTMTYSAFAKVPLEDLLRYEAVILDEAHHCGSRVWGARAKELTENTAGVVIGLTADSVRWSDGGKDVAQEPVRWAHRERLFAAGGDRAKHREAVFVCLHDYRL